VIIAINPPPETTPPEKTTYRKHPLEIHRPRLGVLTLTYPRRGVLILTLTLTDPRGGNYLKIDTNPIFMTLRLTSTRGSGGYLRAVFSVGGYLRGSCLQGGYLRLPKIVCCCAFWRTYKLISCLIEPKIRYGLNCILGAQQCILS